VSSVRTQQNSASLYPVRASNRIRQDWFGSLDARLREAHGTQERQLGNRADALEECVYIILSFQTDVPRTKAVWRALRRQFLTWEHVLQARTDELAAVLQPGGLHRQKASAIRRLLQQVKREHGELSLESLRALDDESAERALLNLHGLSWKGARCVLMYSLRRASFPVDVNVFRVLRRTGAIPARAVYRRRTLHDKVQTLVPAPARRSLHVNLVVHGQEVCLPTNPRCSQCGVASMCMRRGVKLNASRNP
jgi:endonuclease III